MKYRWVLVALLFVRHGSGGPVPSFASPPVVYRPKFRYWLPDASVAASDVDADIAAMAAASAGGLELVPFYNYGREPATTDWSIYGFGTPAFSSLFQAALNSTGRHGLVFDFAVGANQGAGVPSPLPSEAIDAADPGAFIDQGRGLAMELVYGTAALGREAEAPLPPANIDYNYEELESFINPPGLWGESALVAVLAIEIESSNSTVAVINTSSVVELTDCVHNGTVDLRDWTTAENSTWQLMAFYQRYTNARTCYSVANATTWLGNGSWMVDHFSAAGAQRTTDFWDTYLLDDDVTRDLLNQVGEYCTRLTAYARPPPLSRILVECVPDIPAWEDSMEMMAALWWTPDFLDQFQKRHGYSAVPFLPVFFQANNAWGGYVPPYNITYVFNTGGRYNEDYRQTLNEGYQAYLEHFQAWANSHGFNHSCQPAYNLPLDMGADVPLVDAPELETLGFDESIENYLSFTGPAHVGGRVTISTELGAQLIGAYHQTVPELLKLVRDSYAAGVNTIVIHGFPYSGVYPGTTWPGFTPFQYEYSEMWGPRQPAWPHMNDTLLFAARNTRVLKTGAPRIDLAVYAYEGRFSPTGEAPSDTPGTSLSGLHAAGYTHEYIGPESVVRAARTLARAPEMAIYKVTVVSRSCQITPEASAALLALAAANQPIFVVQLNESSANATAIGMRGQEIVSANMQQLLSGAYVSVTAVSEAAFTAALLARTDIAPRILVEAVDAVQPDASAAANNASQQLFSHWRADVPDQTEFVYLLNRGATATFGLAFQVSSRAVPYILDAWTGIQTPLLTYARHTHSGRLRANITLAQEQSIILAFVTAAPSSAPVSVITHSSNIAHVGLIGDRIVVDIQDTREASLCLSNGTAVRFPATSSSASSALAAVKIGSWRVAVESFAAPAVITTSSVAATKSLVTVDAPLATLVPWTQIASLEHLSGLGIYTANFTLAANSSTRSLDPDMRYTLHLTGRIANTVRVFVNGQLVPAFDLAGSGTAADGLLFANGRDISSMLYANGGRNEIRIEVSSTLFNAVKEGIDNIRNIGSPPYEPQIYSGSDWAEFGLVGEVIVQKYRHLII